MILVLKESDEGRHALREPNWEMNDRHKDRIQSEVEMRVRRIPDDLVEGVKVLIQKREQIRGGPREGLNEGPKRCCF